MWFVEIPRTALFAAPDLVDKFDVTAVEVDRVEGGVDDADVEVLDIDGAGECDGAGFDEDGLVVLCLAECYGDGDVGLERLLDAASEEAVRALGQDASQDVVVFETLEFR